MGSFLTDVRYYPDEKLTLVVLQNLAGPDGARVWFVDEGGGAVGATPRGQPEGMGFGPGPSALYPLSRPGG